MHLRFYDAKHKNPKRITMPNPMTRKHNKNQYKTARATTLRKGFIFKKRKCDTKIRRQITLKKLIKLCQTNVQAPASQIQMVFYFAIE